MRILAVAAVAAALFFSPALADDDDRAPASGARPLSQILAEIEAKPDFRYFEDIEWDDGRYEIEYRTRNGGTREIEVDPGK